MPCACVVRACASGVIAVCETCFLTSGPVRRTPTLNTYKVDEVSRNKRGFEGSNDQKADADSFAEYFRNCFSRAGARRAFPIRLANAKSQKSKIGLYLQNGVPIFCCLVTPLLNLNV